MNEVKDGLCIIDAMSGIDCATPQIGQFTDNFDRVKFLLGKDFSDYTMMIITDVVGHVEVVNTDGDNLIKETVDGETYLLWNIGINITSQSGVIVYQIAAYKRNGDAIEETWYSKEGRLVVTESISTNEYSASLIGAYPNLLTRLLIESDNLKNDITDIRQTKVDVKDGFGLSQNSFSDEEKEKLSAIEAGAEVNVPSDWQENDENSSGYIKNKPMLSSVALSGSYNDLKDKPLVDASYDGESYNAQSGKAVKEAIASLVNSSPEALDTLYELSKALGNDPNFAKTVATEMGKKVDKEEGKTLSANDFTDADKEKLLSVQSGAEKNVISDWAEVDPGSDRYIKNKPVLSSVALSGSYNDLTEKPYIPTTNGLASEGYVDTGLEKKADKSTVNDALADIENLKDNKADKSALNDALADISNLKDAKADKTIKINGKPISDDVNLTASDVGALPKDQIVEGFGIPFDVKGTNLVTIDKVHRKEHDVEVGLSSKNLISPSVFADYELQEDGSYYAVHANATEKYPFELSPGTYTVSYQCKADANTGYRIFLEDENGKKYDNFIIHTGNFVSCLFTFTTTAKITKIYMSYSTSGECVYFKDLQIEKGSTTTAYTPHADVLTDAESVTVLGKNLIPFPYLNKTTFHNGVTFTVNEDGTITANGTATAQAYILISNKLTLNLADGTYCLSGTPSENNEDHKCYMTYAGTPQDGTNDGAIININDSVVQNNMTCVVSAGKTVNNFVFKPMLEAGTQATEFELYKKATYPVTDGKAIVKSVSPTMNIKASESGVNIEAKGYQDGLSVIDELKQSIISLGGNI